MNRTGLTCANHRDDRGTHFCAAYDTVKMLGGYRREMMSEANWLALKDAYAILEMGVEYDPAEDADRGGKP